VKRNRRAGVTLLELLIALWVMAAAAVILASTLGLAGRALVRVGADAADVEAITARVMLRRWLEGMPVGARIVGDAGGMTFGALIDEPPMTAARVTEVRVTAEGGAVRAVAGDGALAAELAGEGALVGLAYFGSPGPGIAPGWRTDWPATAEILPDLVRISYETEGRIAPPLTVRPARLARQSEMSLSSP
jgi:hypothetical protein